MAIGVENGEFIGVPVPEGIDRPPIEARFYFREISGDRVEIHHPFHGNQTFGNASTIPDRHLDAAAVVLFQQMPYLVDSMKLNRIRQFETRPFAGEYPQLSHCASLGIIGVEFAGGPMDILDGLFNDASHIYDGHQGDDNYQGHGQETLHDLDRQSFFEKAGLIDALIEAGSLRRTASGIFVANTRLSIESLLNEDEAVVRRSFLSNKHKAHRLDGDKFQYSSEESFYLRTALHKDKPDPARIAFAMASLSLESTARMIIVDDGEGDQLVATDENVAWTDVKEYLDHNAEHWCEPVQDLLNDVLNLVERYFFVSHHPHARNYQYFYPRDYLHTSASLMFEQFEKVAQDDRVMDWLLRFAEKIAADQRQKTVFNHTNGNKYAGPNPPDGITLRPVKLDGSESSFNIVGDKLVANLPKGKIRTIDTRVKNGSGKTRPISSIREQEYSDYLAESQRWIGDYAAEIEVEDPKIRAALARALKLVEEEWPHAIKLRPPMPSKELRLTIQEANNYVREKGKIK